MRRIRIVRGLVYSRWDTIRSWDDASGNDMKNVSRKATGTEKLGDDGRTTRSYEGYELWVHLLES